MPEHADVGPLLVVPGVVDGVAGVHGLHPQGYDHQVPVDHPEEEGVDHPGGPVHHLVDLVPSHRENLQDCIVNILNTTANIGYWANSQITSQFSCTR